jgi:glycosyltransferase involved in cell wall biosynthesis
MKVLLLSTWGEACGIAGYAAHLAAELRRGGTTVDVFAVERERQRYMTRIERRAHFETFLRRARDYDVVHIQHEFGFFGVSPFESLRLTSRMLGTLRRRRTPTFVTFHSVPPEMRRDRAAPRLHWRQRARRTAAQVAWNWCVARHFRPGGSLHAVVHSQLGRRVLHESGVALARIDVVPHGVTPIPVDAHRQQARRMLGIADDTFLVVQTGFLSWYKGADIALKAFGKLAQDSAPVRLALVGGPHPHAHGDDGFADIVRRARRLGNVTITGYVEADEVARYLAAADLCVAPYRDVGLLSSAALAGALGAGAPIIASRIDAFREIAHFHGCLELVPVDSPEALAFAIERMRRSPSALAALRERANQYRAAHGWERVAAAQRALYAAACPAATPGAHAAAPKPSAQ